MLSTKLLGASALAICGVVLAQQLILPEAHHGALLILAASAPSHPSLARQLLLVSKRDNAPDSTHG
jgi:hypothetical protein